MSNSQQEVSLLHFAYIYERQRKIQACYTQHIKLELKHKSRDRNEMMQCNNLTRGDMPGGVSCCG
jgi:hypothetical protein